MNVDVTTNIKLRLIEMTARYWAQQPKYRDLVVSGEYSFEERPQHGIVIRPSGGENQVQDLSNYRGIVHSYCMLARWKNAPGMFLEWVREDSIAIQRNGGVFPSLPGVYHISVVGGGTKFIIDPLLDAPTETLTKVSDLEYHCSKPFLKGSLILKEQPNDWLIHEGIDYTVELDYEGRPTGRIFLVEAIRSGYHIEGTFRYLGDLSPEYTIIPESVDNDAIPGVTLAFGSQIEDGDTMAVVVQPTRIPAYLEFGGRWSVNLDCEVITRDSLTRTWISDRTMLYLWGVARSQLSTEGYEITQVSPGGESEEIYDEAGEDHWYLSQFNVTAETEWAVHIPLVLSIKSVDTYYLEQLRYLAQLSDLDAGYLSVLGGEFSSLSLRPTVQGWAPEGALPFEVIK